MVHLNKAFIISTLTILPCLAAPVPFDQEDVELVTREPLLRAVKHAASKTYNRVTNSPTFQKFSNVARPVAAAVGNHLAYQGGKRGLLGSVASGLLSGRAVQDELDARGYDIQLDLRQLDGLDARDISEALEARDDVYTLSARDFIDYIESEARRELSDDFEARQLAEGSSDELD
jgi:hypothetical protein